MTTVLIILIVLAANYLVMDLVGSVLIFLMIIYRSPRTPRTRDCLETKNTEKIDMFAQGLEWSRKHVDRTKQLEVVSDGLKLYGEYVDFGYKQCAIILQGRTESLVYSYYYADVYANSGHNILVIDIRAHGLSDGKYHTSGIRESDDLIVWIDFMRKTYGIDDFTVHGVCVGGATAVYAYHKMLSRQSMPIRRIVTDGLFISNYEMFRRNMRDYWQPAFPTLHLAFLLARLLAKVDLFKETPIRYMPDIQIPVLFIWSVEDRYCLPAKGKQLFAACASDSKSMRFFPKGRHSHVRYCQPEAYDSVITDFLALQAH